jgi:hypothetical protein
MIVGGDAAPARRAAAGGEPLIASSLISGLRRQLIESGAWAQVRDAALAHDPRAREWIDTPLVGDWIPVHRHVEIMNALAAVAGDEGTREAGRERLRGTLRGGVLAPVLRGWMRSYSGAPAQLLRVAPHAWNAVVRGAGTMEHVSTGPREVRFRIVRAPEIVRDCAAWHRFLEGYGVGILEAGSYEGSVEIRPGAPGVIDAVFSWR